jgi:hypothetical protein
LGESTRIRSAFGDASVSFSAEESGVSVVVFEGEGLRALSTRRILPRTKTAKTATIINIIFIHYSEQYFFYELYEAYTADYILLPKLEMSSPDS